MKKQIIRIIASVIFLSIFIYCFVIPSININSTTNNFSTYIYPIGNYTLNENITNSDTGEYIQTYFPPSKNGLSKYIGSRVYGALVTYQLDKDFEMYGGWLVDAHRTQYTNLLDCIYKAGIYKTRCNKYDCDANYIGYQSVFPFAVQSNLCGIGQCCVFIKYPDMCIF